MDGSNASENGNSLRMIHFALANTESDQTTDKRSGHARGGAYAPERVQMLQAAEAGCPAGGPRGCAGAI